jgi:hypothetical protein
VDGRRLRTAGIRRSIHRTLRVRVRVRAHVRVRVRVRVHILRDAARQWPDRAPEQRTLDQRALEQRAQLRRQAEPGLAPTAEPSSTNTTEMAVEQSNYFNFRWTGCWTYSVLGFHVYRLFRVSVVQQVDNQVNCVPLLDDGNLFIRQSEIVGDSCSLLLRSGPSVGTLK